MNICKLFIIFLVLSIVMVGCKRDSGLVIDLTGLTKPIVDSINPGGIVLNNSGFHLTIRGDFSGNDRYALYLNKKKCEVKQPSFSNLLEWTITETLLKEVLGSDVSTIQVRVSSIANHDISNDFDRYEDYLSGVKELQVNRNSTSFSEPFRIFPEWGRSMDPILRNDGNGNLYLAWKELIDGVWQAMFCYSRDGGQTWSQCLDISRSAISIDSMDMNIDTQGNFYMVWTRRGSGPRNLYFSRSLDYGVTWYNPEIINETPGYQTTIPRIDVNMTGELYVVWDYHTQDDIYNSNDSRKIVLLASQDQGANWAEVFSKKTEGYDELNGYPAVNSGVNGEIYVLHGFSDAIECHRSGDQGLSWRMNQIPTENFFNNYRHTTMVVNSTNSLFIAWNREIGGRNPATWIHFVKGTDGDNSWNEIQDMDEICKTSGPQVGLAASNSRLGMVLESRYGLFYLLSTDIGQTWTFPESIPGTEKATDPSMVVDGIGTLYLVYVSDRDYSFEGSGAIHFMTWKH